MGKIRIKTIGLPELEQAQKEKAKKRREAKKEKKKIRAPGLKGGERVVAVGPTPEELEAIPTLKSPEPPTSPIPPKSPKLPKPPKSLRSKRYQQSAKLIDKTKAYPIKEAIALLRKTALSRFNGTVEVHLNVKEKGLSGLVFLPHGTGKKQKIAIADDTLIKQLEKNTIDFDVLISPPSMMSKLAKFGKLLGPRGLMPNPKAGTVTDDLQKKLRDLTRGKIQFKTEKQAPIIHFVIGKMDFKDDQLIENFKALVKTIGPSKIKKAVLKSTISPGIKCSTKEYPL